MKRTKKESDVVWWRKKGGGSLHMRIDGRMKIIKQNQKFPAKPEEIPETFRDVIVPIDASELNTVEKKQQSIDVKSLKYTVKSKGGGWFDVIDATGKVVNEKALRQEAADQLVKDLTSE